MHKLGSRRRLMDAAALVRDKERKAVLRKLQAGDDDYDTLRVMVLQRNLWRSLKASQH
jgi:hypothetical protein